MGLPALMCPKLQFHRRIVLAEGLCWRTRRGWAHNCRGCLYGDINLKKCMWCVCVCAGGGGGIFPTLPLSTCTPKCEIGQPSLNNEGPETHRARQRMQRFSAM